ncbi:ankyrin-1-like isoform X2 [Oscarella lobularis]|uniref:ankyrin-1-like isoform X2 n=1 Tax=Oscarella lobularis TaxID=121494 RepID=UPI0033134B3B
MAGKYLEEFSGISCDKKSDWEKEERLYSCVEKGDLQSVKEIISSGKVDLSRVYVNKELICGEDRIRGHSWSLITVAVLKRKFEILKELIRRGAAVYDEVCIIKENASNYYFESGGLGTSLTPLMVACVIGDESAVELLVENGAKISPNLRGTTALKLAFANGRIQIAESFMKKACVDEPDDRAPLFFYACFGGLKMVKLWLKYMKNDAQLNPYYTTEYGVSAIHWAVKGVQIDVVDWLCKREFWLLSTDGSGWNVFHFLAQSTHKEESDRIDFLVQLVEKVPIGMIDANVPFLLVPGHNPWGRCTPLSLACLWRNFGLARKLLEFGVQPKFDINTGTTLMWVMFDNDDQDIDVAKDIAKAIAELKIEFSGLAFSDNGFDTDRAKEAFDSFVAEKLLVAKMPGVIHWAVRYGSPLSLDHLLRDGANLEDKDKDGCTPIMRCSSLENLKWLVQHNANYQVVDKSKNSLLHLYGKSMTHSPSVLQYLLNLGLSLEAENDDGMKPHETAKDEMQVFLRAEYKQMLSFRIDSERVQPECVQTCLVGEPMAGKTTLTNSLCGIAP